MSLLSLIATVAKSFGISSPADNASKSAKLDQTSAAKTTEDQREMPRAAVQPDSRNQP